LRVPSIQIAIDNEAAHSAKLTKLLLVQHTGCWVQELPATATALMGLQVIPAPKLRPLATPRTPLTAEVYCCEGKHS